MAPPFLSPAGGGGGGHLPPPGPPWPPRHWAGWSIDRTAGLVGGRIPESDILLIVFMTLHIGPTNIGPDTYLLGPIRKEMVDTVCLQALIQEFRRGVAGPGVVKGGGCGRGMCPLPREARKFFLLAVDILCMKKCFL